MPLRSSLLLIALLVSGCASAPPAPRLQVVDLTDDFGRFYDTTASMEEAERIAAMQQHLEALLPGFYDAGRRSFPAGFDYSRLIGAALTNYPKQRAGIEDVSRRFASLSEPAIRSFEATVGPFTEPRTVYLLHSLGEMDGGMRTLRDGSFLIFGADVIARVHLQHDVQPFFHHELFHLWHASRFKGCGDALWCDLWTEGLAVFVAASLNPKVTDAELLLNFPEPLRPAVEQNRKEAVCAVVQRFDSTAAADSSTLFRGSPDNRLSPTIPPRFGYYVGYLAAAEAAKSHSLKTLAHMPPEEVRPLLLSSLNRLADCDR
ncbi:MAG TPA: hypothetical protein VE010_25010 [Thermoanaerobaculia bacterium]|nr:hypothetical protein [Thermoanaerobaculia bacterium]